MSSQTDIELAESIAASRLGSSGNLLADKRYAYAEALLAEGHVTAAVDLFQQAIEKAPDWAAAYLALGLALEKSKAMERARDAFVKAQALDAEGTLGADLHVARTTGEPIRGMSLAYVAALFDQYAPRFETHLIDRLGYRGPQVLLDAIGAVATGRCFAEMLDLGCGTGLMARALTGRTVAIDGIDLSVGMVERASETGLYRRVMSGDCVAASQGLPPARYDLVTAADMLVYLGDLQPLFMEVSRMLRPGGLFAATLETAVVDGYALADDLRFRHTARYVRGVLETVRLDCVSMEACTTRTESGHQVQGLVFVARAA